MKAPPYVYISSIEVQKGVRESALSSLTDIYYFFVAFWPSWVRVSNSVLSLQIFADFARPVMARPSSLTEEELTSLGLESQAIRKLLALLKYSTSPQQVIINFLFISYL
jgi:hypothetical protein